MTGCKLVRALWDIYHFECVLVFMEWLSVYSSSTRVCGKLFFLFFSLAFFRLPLSEICDGQVFPASVVLLQSINLNLPCV